jgi:hypothetical protein
VAFEHQTEARREQDVTVLGTLAPIDEYLAGIEVDGGPLIYNGSEDAQCSLDSTCRKLHRFLSQPQR